MKSKSTKKTWKYKGAVIEIPGGELGWYPSILKAFAGQLDKMLECYGSVLAVRFDVQVEEFTTNNSVISELRLKIVRYLQRAFDGLGIGFLWVREQADTAVKQHYHWVIMVDGSRVAPSRLTGLLRELFRRSVFYHLHIPKNCYCIVKNFNNKDYRKLIARTSYLTKVRQKHSCPEGVHEYGVSRFK